MYYKRSPPFFPSLLLACVSSFIILACALQLNSFFFFFLPPQGLFDGGKVKSYFRKVKNFLDRHPNEVLTIIIANPEKVPGNVWQPIFESTGKLFLLPIYLLRETLQLNRNMQK